jgi:hypothetical protein
VLILDDLLWVLTDDQLKAALHFVDSISGKIGYRITFSDCMSRVGVIEINFTLSGFGTGLDPQSVGSVDPDQDLDFRRLEASP